MRNEALEQGKKAADDWYKLYEPILKAKQVIERRVKHE